MNSDAEMLQAIEHLADQIDRLATMLDECVTLTRADVPDQRTVDRSVCRGAGAVNTTISRYRISNGSLTGNCAKVRKRKAAKKR